MINVYGIIFLIIPIKVWWKGFSMVFIISTIKNQPQF